MAQGPQTVQEYTDATALNEARRKYLDSLNALNATQKPDAAAQALAAAQQAGDLAKAQLATEQSRSAILKSQFDVPQSPYTGSVTLGANAGVIQAKLLAAQAVNEAAQTIVDNRLGKLVDGKPVSVCAGTDIPNFAALTTFRAQQRLLVEALKRAGAALDKASGNSGGIARANVVGGEYVEAAGAALAAADKLLGFFRTDYSLSGADVEPDDLLILNAFAGALAARNTSTTVRVPRLYTPATADVTSLQVMKDLEALNSARDTFEQKLLSAERAADALGAQAASGTDAETKAAAQQAATTLKAQIADATIAATATDAFLARLSTTDEKGNTPLTQLLLLQSFSDTLSHDGYVLYTKLAATGGSNYTRRNLWDFFGGMPFFSMGGAVVTYALMKGDTAQVVAAGVLPVDGGYKKVTALRKYLQDLNAPSKEPKPSASAGTTTH